MRAPYPWYTPRSDRETSASVSEATSSANAPIRTATATPAAASAVRRPGGLVHRRSRRPLFLLSPRVDGDGGRVPAAGGCERRVGLRADYHALHRPGLPRAEPLVRVRLGPRRPRLDALVGERLDEQLR